MWDGGDVTEEIGPRQVIPLMIRTSGLSTYGVSMRLGKSRNWGYNLKGSDPRASTVAKVGKVTGHEMAILDTGTGDVVAVVRECPCDEDESETGKTDETDENEERLLPSTEENVDDDKPKDEDRGTEGDS